MWVGWGRCMGSVGRVGKVYGECEEGVWGVEGV